MGDTDWWPNRKFVLSSPAFNMKSLTPICLIALILAFAMALEQGNGGYDLLTCGESKGTNPDSDPEVDKHCVHTRVDSIPTDPKGDEKDRDLRCTLFFYGRCKEQCESGADECHLRWYFWRWMIKEVKCDCLYYTTRAPGVTGGFGPIISK